MMNTGVSPPAVAFSSVQSVHIWLRKVCTMCLQEDIGNEAGPIPLRKR